MKIGNGGPAFPVRREGPNQTSWQEEGLTLRDYFAVHAPPQRTDFTDYGAAALVGREMPDYPGDDASEQARADYQIATAQFRIDLDVALRLRWADAMLKARES